MRAFGKACGWHFLRYDVFEPPGTGRDDQRLSRGGGLQRFRLRRAVHQGNSQHAGRCAADDFQRDSTAHRQAQQGKAGRCPVENTACDILDPLAPGGRHDAHRVICLHGHRQRCKDAGITAWAGSTLAVHVSYFCPAYHVFAGHRTGDKAVQPMEVRPNGD